MDILQVRSAQGEYSAEFLARLCDVAAFVTSLPRGPVVVDANVVRLYPALVASISADRPIVELSATEESKSLDGMRRVLDGLQRAGCRRESAVVAMGGGIVQDVTALAAHLYHRGLSWAFVPTTLLSMCDSCIGAKAAVNFGGFKNQLGCFHAPARIGICGDFLNTLSETDLRSGYGELLKLMLIECRDAFDELRGALARDGFRSPRVTTFVRRALAVKKRFIEADEFDRRERRLLNYGHTFGHALEAVSDHRVPHGVAVAWGLDLANWISVRLGRLDPAAFATVHAFVMEWFGWPVPAGVSGPMLVDAARRDKKVSGDHLQLVLMEQPGRLSLEPIEFAQVLALVEEYLKTADALPSVG